MGVRVYGGVRLDVWGPLIVRNGQRPVAIPSGRLQTLLTCLAVSGGELVPSDTLAERVWGEDLPARPRGALHTCVTRLRRLLGPGAVESTSGGYLLRVSRDDVDLLRFRDLVKQARASADEDAGQELRLLREALSLRRGEPFGGVTSLWLEHEVAPRVEEEWFAALARRIDLDLAAGNYRDLIPELRDLTAAFPLREAAWERLMLALHGCGRRVEALEVFQRVRSILSEEVGIDPSDRLQRLHRAVLDDSPELRENGGVVPDGGPDAAAVPPVPPRQLPSDVARFTGRRAALAALDALLSDRGGRTDRSRPIVIAMVSGTAGVGKTALAVHWAHRVQDRFPDGQLYVNLRGYGPSAPAAPAAVLEGFLHALGIPASRIPGEVEARSALFRTTLAGRRMLVMLDNARDADQVRPLLPGSRSLVLITSRGQLRGLAARDGAHRITLDRLEPDESAALLGEILGAERVGRQPAAVARLAELCAHLPLALGIAAELAGRQPVDTLDGVVQQLGDERQRLEILDTGDDPHGSVRAVLSWSYQALTPTAARLFRLLGLYPGTDIGAPAAAALSGLPVPRAGRLLDELAGRHQLREHPPGRYEPHDLLRVYAKERVDLEETPAESTAAIHRLLDWYLHTAANARAVLLPGRPVPGLDKPGRDVTPLVFNDVTQALAWCDAERSGLVAAVHQAAGRDLHTLAWQLADALWVFLDLRQAGDDWISLCHAGLRAARRTGDRRAQALMHKGLGNAHLLLRRHGDALIWYGRALALYGESDDRAGQADVLNNMGLVYEDLERFEESIRHHERSLAIVRELGNTAAVASKLGNLAIAYKSVGRYHEAVDAGRQALAANRETGDRRGEACVLGTLGDVHRELGEHPAAIDQYHQALRFNRELGNRGDEAINLTSLGRAQRDAGFTAQAGRTWSLALAILEDLRSPQAERVRDWLAELHR
jgi:DNA-binding SARP family transcriptional activator